MERHLMAITPRKRPSAIRKKRHHRARLLRIAARRRRAPLGGRRGHS